MKHINIQSYDRHNPTVRGMNFSYLAFAVPSTLFALACLDRGVALLPLASPKLIEERLIRTVTRVKRNAWKCKKCCPQYKHIPKMPTLTVNSPSKIGNIPNLRKHQFLTPIENKQ